MDHVGVSCHTAHGSSSDWLGDVRLCPASAVDPTDISTIHIQHNNVIIVQGKGSPYSIAERRVLELIPVLGSQPAGDVSHKRGGRLPLLSARPAVTPATLERAATNFAAW